MKIAVIANLATRVWVFRREFISELVRLGHDVTVIVHDDEPVDKIRSLGVSVVVVPFHRYTSPIRDLLYFAILVRFLKKTPFDIVYTITAKPNIYGTIAAWLAGVPKRCCLVSGLGTGFLDAKSRKLRLVQTCVKTLYKIAGRCAHKFLFQNDDDRRFMVDAKIVRETKTHVIKSSGVNLDVFSPEKIDGRAVLDVRKNLFGVADDTIVVGVVARTLAGKGIREFIAAGKEAVNWNKKVRFIHVGQFDPEDVLSLKIEELEETKTYKWVGFQADVPVAVQAMDIMVLPSYSEGVPKSVIEGMALAKPIVTTHAPGCRETVDEGVNGLLVPIKDSHALAEAVKVLVMDDALRAKMGKASREKAEREFDVRDVNRRIITEVLELPWTVEEDATR